MPLLQGQPFRLIPPPEIFPKNVEIYIIQHTGEKFYIKSDYEDRLALYSQSIWTCQCTGRTGLTHKEAWTSEAKVRNATMNVIPVALQKPLLALVHHSLSPLEQLIEAASILCYSQFHVGEELIYLKNQSRVHIVNSKEGPKVIIEPVANGVPNDEDDVLNGTPNGLTKQESPGTSPGKENQTKDCVREEPFKKEMLPRLYDVLVIENNKLLENISYKDLQRPYKLPSKDQIRLFIRSCALRHRGTTCTPWVVTEELIKKYSIPNKLPTVFLSSPKPLPSMPSTKRKAHSPSTESVKRVKSEKTKLQKSGKVAPLILKSENLQKTFFNIIKTPNNAERINSTIIDLTTSPNKMKNFSQKGLVISPNFKPITKHPLSLGKPKILHKSSNFALPKPSSTPISGTPRKRGRPPLSKEEKERNKKLRQASLFDLSKKAANQVQGKLIKIRTHSSVSNSGSHVLTSSPFFSASYKSPVKRANTSEAIMKLPFMRKFAHEHRTIKGVIGQFRRLAHTMDIVLAKLSSEQIEMIPDETMREDLWARQKKVKDKKFIQNMTPEEKKQYMRDKARNTALERWKERKLKNLKIEDKTLNDLKPLPNPTLVDTPEPLPNSLFGDVVMVTEFIHCFKDLLLGEEKFQMTTRDLMQAIISGSKGFKIITDILCYLLPTIIHDDISKNCKEIGVAISSVPVTYQTAPELARLCLRELDDDDSGDYQLLDEVDQIGMEKSELPEELLSKMEKCEFWDLEYKEIIAIIKALVHKTLSTASLSVYVEEVEENNLKILRERRKFLKQIQKEKESELSKKKEERRLNKEAKGNQPKKQRGRPRGYSPKMAAMNMQKYLKPKEPEKPAPLNPIAAAVFKRRQSTEDIKKEKAEQRRLEKERLKQQEEQQKREAVDKKYEEAVTKRENILRRTPIGYDRDHNRYWIFHTSTPGLFVEKGWVDHCASYQCSSSPLKKTQPSSKIINQVDVIVKSESTDEDDKPLSVVMAEKVKKEDQEVEQDEDDKPLAAIKSKLSISPLKMSCRGRPPKEAYVLVDEDTQTFPEIGENKWYRYTCIEEINDLKESLTDKGHRESQLRAAINLNMSKLQNLYSIKSEPIVLNDDDDTSSRLMQSLKEDIAQIERELIEGWLGGISEFEEWEKKVLEAENVSELGVLLIEAQKHMQLKNLKGLMVAEKKQIPNENPDLPPETEEVEGPGVQRWREAVLSCMTYSRLHVLVGLFDSCIKWEKSMATRKCKICRSKMKDDPLLLCDKCENSYHWYCLRPPLKEDPGEHWLCPPCMPKKIRREESGHEIVETNDDPDEKEDPTFVLSKTGRVVNGKRSRKSLTSKQKEKECVMCLGRIGLIICSKCSSAYHSECHDPPLLSRARKDWVCGVCVNPILKAKNFGNVQENEPTQFRKKLFEPKDEVKERIPRKAPPRGNLGRFVQKTKIQFPSLPTDAEVEDSESACESDHKTEEVQMDKYGRSVRGAKAKALENMTGEGPDSTSRRSSRNKDIRKSYTYESGESSDDSEAESENDEESQSEDGEDVQESEKEDEQGSEKEDEQESEKEDEESDREEEGTGSAEEEDDDDGSDEEEDVGGASSDDDTGKKDDEDVSDDNGQESPVGDSEDVSQSEEDDNL